DTQARIRNVEYCELLAAGGEGADEVDHVAPERAGLAEQPVDQVAHRSAEDQPHRHGPRPGPKAPREPQDRAADHDGDDGEDEGESLTEAEGGAGVEGEI